MRVENGKVGGEHGCRDLPAVGTVADEGAHETRFLGREGELDGAAEASCRCGVVLGPAIVGSAGKGEVGLGFIGSGRHGGEFLCCDIMELWGSVGLVYGAAVDVVIRDKLFAKCRVGFYLYNCPIVNCNAVPNFFGMALML